VPQTPPRCAVLVVRVWVEGDSRRQLRGRLTQTLNAASARQEVAYVRSEDDVYAAVRSWLQAFLRLERPVGQA
jgi:hypothetical protein